MKFILHPFAFILALVFCLAPSVRGQNPISSYTAFPAVAPGDFLIGVDVSDTTMAPTGTTKKLTITTFSAYLASLSETLSGKSMSGATNTFTAIPATAINLGTVSNAEFGYLTGVTSAIQTQLNAKAPIASPTFTGTVTIPTPFTLGAVSVTATGTELNYSIGVTSAIQTQLNAKAPLSSPTFTGTVTMPTPFTLGAVSVTPTGTELNFVDGVTSAIQTQLDARALLTTNTFTGVQTLTDTTAATSSTTGALIVAGGIGVDKDSWFNSVRVGTGAGGDIQSAAFGRLALNATTSGTFNTGIGNAALYYNTTGSYLTAVGNSAGSFQADGTTPLTTAESSVYLGSNARGFSNADVNSIVIGASAIGEGANTTVIGNSSTTSTHIFGALTASLTGSTGLPLATGVTGDLPFANLTQLAARSVLGVAGASTADVAAITASTTGTVLRLSGTVGFGSLELDNANTFTNILPSSKGGARSYLYVIYVETDGNDTTGVGSQGRPYATAQKAYNVAAAAGVGNYTIQLGAGNFAGIATTATWSTNVKSIVGVGHKVSFLGGINASGANGATGAAGGAGQTITVWSDQTVNFGVVTSNGGSGGNGVNNGGSSPPLNSGTPGIVGGAAGNGGAAAAITLDGCIFQTVSAVGGAGGTGGTGQPGADTDDGAQAANGGNGGAGGNSGAAGIIALRRCRGVVTGSVESGNNGAGSGGVAGTGGVDILNSVLNGAAGGAGAAGNEGASTSVTLTDCITGSLSSGTTATSGSVTVLRTLFSSCAINGSPLAPTDMFGSFETALQ